MPGLTSSPSRPLVSALVGMLALPAAAVAAAVALSTPQSISPGLAGDRPFVLSMKAIAAEAPAEAARHGPAGVDRATRCSYWAQAAEELPFCGPPCAVVVVAGAE